MFQTGDPNGQEEELVDITDRIAQAIRDVNLKRVALICNSHTTCGLTINENADPDVAADILLALRKAVHDNLPYAHLEGKFHCSR